MSILLPEYRSYGLMDKHTSIGAEVLIGCIALLGFSARYKNLYSYLILAWGCIALTIGMASLAWLSFFFIAPIVFSITKQKKYLSLCLNFYFFMFILVILTLCILNNIESDLFVKFMEVFKAQISHVSNFNDSGRTSYFFIYKENLYEYLNFIGNDPVFFFLGEGFSPMNSYPRGGDVALLEILATYGVPLSIVLLVSVVFYFKKIFLNNFANGISQEERGILAFGLGILAAFVFSLLHYNTFSNKAFFVMIPISFGLLSKFSVPKVA
jgi:hypothetical protein